MPVAKEHQADLKLILAKRRDQGADYWSTPDGRWGTGSPFSTFDCVLILHELGVPRTDPVLKGAAETILGSWRDDGRFRPAPKGAIYPCHTANAARALCRLGYARDARLKKTFEHLLDAQHTDGGWRCNRAPLGKSAKTDASNPGVTLAVLDAFRFTPSRDDEPRLRRAVKSLLSHWKSRAPLGPCSFGIGTLFNQVEFPFLRYNLFYYVYVLSFYDAAKGSSAFRGAMRLMESKLVDGQVVIENPNRRLAALGCFAKGMPSRPATKRWREVLKNIGT